MDRVREERKVSSFQTLKKEMVGDGKRKEEMRHQSRLRTEMEVAYKRGDADQVKRLESRLKPDEEWEK